LIPASVRVWARPTRKMGELTRTSVRITLAPPFAPSLDVHPHRLADRGGTSSQQETAALVEIH
jgi:hypothetical protein